MSPAEPGKRNKSGFRASPLQQVEHSSRSKQIVWLQQREERLEPADVERCRTAVTAQ
jgi:hypothetical protein